jgi:hypothetical protein
MRKPLFVQRVGTHVNNGQLNKYIYNKKKIKGLVLNLSQPLDKLTVFNPNINYF